MSKNNNYGRYTPDRKDRIKIALIALLIDAVIIYMFYKNIILCMLAYPVCAYAVYREYGRMAVVRRKRIFEEQFEEFLSCISSLLAAGYSLENTIYEAKKEMALLYEENTDIMQEINNMCHEMELNKPVEYLFRELANRVDIDDITTFSEMVAISKRSGGDLIAIVRQTLSVIHSRREVNNEINTMIAAKRYENRIMNLMPVMMLIFMSVFSAGYLDVLYNNLTGIMVMTVCIIIYGASWTIGSRIMNIESYSGSGIKDDNISDKSVRHSGDIRKDRLYRVLVCAGLGEYLADIRVKLHKIYPAGKSIELWWWNRLKKNVLMGLIICIVLLMGCLLISSENLPYVVMIILVILIGIPYCYVNDVNKKIKKRNGQLIMDYPDCINRFILLLGTGINMKSTWERMCTQYSAGRKKGRTMHYVYEEMINSFSEMKRGVPEAEVYERFGRRVRLLPYMRLSAMLSQNLKKGNKRMIEQLRITSMDALTHRRETMKQLGEEASSKLLLPMMMQFILILIIIMYPAIRTL